MQNFYQADLAYVHHNGFGGFAREAGEELLGLFLANGIDSGLVVDLGCGSGIWAARLSGAGYQVLGRDVSPAMLDIARQQAPQARFEQSSAFTDDIPACRVITALGEVLGYGNPTDEQIIGLFARAERQLAEGGMLVFDVILSSADHSLDYRSWQTGPDWAVLVDSREIPGQNRLLRDITVFREVNGHYRRSGELHSVRLFDAGELKTWLQDAGFDVGTGTRYGSYNLANRRLAVIARKRRC